MTPKLHRAIAVPASKALMFMMFLKSGVYTEFILGLGKTLHIGRMDYLAVAFGLTECQLALLLPSKARCAGGP
jgi:hypothetical protein